MVLNKFTIASDDAIVALGNSERRKTGELAVRTLQNFGYFKNVILTTINELDEKSLRTQEIRAKAKDMAVITHSAALQRFDEALQIIALNPPEQTSYMQLLFGAMRMAKDPIDDEPGAHKRNLGDAIGATREFLGSPISSYRTVHGIARGFSAVEHLIERADDFPKGRAIIHAHADAFGFQKATDVERAQSHGIVTELIAGFHTEFLFAPLRVMREIEPIITIPPLGQR